MKKTISGFTIVELLIVIVVIAILAAISIVAYNGVQDRARITAAQANLRDTFNKIQTFYAIEGRYPATAAELAGLNLKVSGSAFQLSNNSFVYCRYTDESVMAIAGRVAGTGVPISYSTNGGLKEMSSFGSSINQRCNIAFGESGTDLTGKAVINGTVAGPPVAWAAWTGAN